MRVKAAVVLALVSFLARADELRILSWSPRADGRIQTYTAVGAKSGEPIPAPAIPAGGLPATLIATLGDLYRVQIGDTVLYVRDASIKNSQSKLDPSNVCNSSVKRPDGGERRTIGVAEECKKASQ